MPEPIFFLIAIKVSQQTELDPASFLQTMSVCLALMFLPTHNRSYERIERSFAKKKTEV